jgi:uncharacterized protein (TIGR02598 family)
LIEVVLALAVSAIGLMAILGLLPQGLEASRNAADNTISATIVHDIFSTLRAGQFTTATNVNSLGFSLPIGPVCNLQTFTGSTSAGFDQAGFTTNSASGQPNAYYKVVLTFQPEAPVGTPASVSVVTATVVWPALSASPINTNVFVTKVAQYNQ